MVCNNKFKIVFKLKVNTLNGILRLQIGFLLATNSCLSNCYATLTVFEYTKIRNIDLVRCFNRNKLSWITSNLVQSSNDPYSLSQ